MSRRAVLFFSHATLSLPHKRSVSQAAYIITAGSPNYHRRHPYFLGLDSAESGRLPGVGEGTRHGTREHSFGSRSASGTETKQNGPNDSGAYCCCRAETSYLHNSNLLCFFVNERPTPYYSIRKLETSFERVDLLPFFWTQ